METMKCNPGGSPWPFPWLFECDASFRPWIAVELPHRIFAALNHFVYILCCMWYFIILLLIWLCRHGDGLLASTLDLIFSWGCLWQPELVVVVCACVCVCVCVWQSVNECNTSHLGTRLFWQTCLYPCAYRGRERAMQRWISVAASVPLWKTDLR